MKRFEEGKVMKEKKKEKKNIQRTELGGQWRRKKEEGTVGGGFRQ